MNKIAFIGVGIMGRSMVRNLMKAGFELHIYARTRSKVEDVPTPSLRRPTTTFIPSRTCASWCIR